MPGNEDEFLEIISDHAGIIRKVANSYSGSVVDRDDLVQEITMQLWRSRKSFDPAFKMSTWIYRVALNVAITSYRRTRRHRKVVALEVDCEVPDSEQTPDNVRQLYELINELDELNRAVMLLYLERFTYEEISQSLGISKTNVATKVARLKKKLKQRFQQ